MTKVGMVCTWILLGIILINGKRLYFTSMFLCMVKDNFEEKPLFWIKNSQSTISNDSRVHPSETKPFRDDIVLTKQNMGELRARYETYPKSCTKAQLGPKIDDQTTLRPSPLPIIVLNDFFFLLTLIVDPEMTVNGSEHDPFDRDRGLLCA